MNTTDLLPRVVSRTYFNATGYADVDAEPDRFGFVSHLGHDLYAFLACVEKGLIRNVHQEHLDHLGLTIEEANKAALVNLSKLAFDGESIQQTLTKTGTGNDWAVWLGSEFTSSCILLPELYRWCRKHLRSESFLVRVPSTQLLFVIQLKSADAVDAFDKYIASVTDDADNLVSSHWFLLDQSGLAPYGDDS